MKTLAFTPPTPEADFLLTCARVNRTDAHTHHLRDLLTRSLDWSRLLALAARHGLLPLLARHLLTLSADSVPPDIVAHLRAHQQSVALRNLGMGGELVRVLRLFADLGIPALPFKGPTLAQFAYGNLALREFGDLDLLLRPGDVPRAQALLLTQGYQPQYALTPAQETAYLYYLCQIPLAKPERALVELHSALAPRLFRFALDFAHLWPRRCIVTLAGQAVPAPGAEDLLMLLCMHGAKHLWKNLGWICDLAELLRSRPLLDWEQICREARRLRSERQLHLGLHLAERVLQAPLPLEMARAARRDPAVRELADVVLRHLLDEVEWTPSGLTSAAFHFRLRERWRDGLSYCVSLLVLPTLADWQAVSLPAPLAFLYFGVRPVRLLGKYLRLTKMR